MLQRIFFLVLLISIIACDQKQNTEITKATTSTQATKATNPKTKNAPVTSSGKKLPTAEKGITIVSESGWTKDQMDFQQGYCEQTMANLDQIDGVKFCECFLEKVQYYYEPIYVRDAYEDQQKWNQECYAIAEK